jgi:hypothetical protein
VWRCSPAIRAGAPGAFGQQHVQEGLARQPLAAQVPGDGGGAEPVPAGELAQRESAGVEQAP